MLKRIVSILLIGGILMFSLSGCFGEKYHVDYGGRKDSFTGAKDTYRAGTKVVLYYEFIATDTDYSFYLDEERIKPDYEESKGYIISFTMPAHDVSLRVEARNTMMYIPQPETTAVLEFDSFDGGGPEYTVTVDDPSVVAYDQTRHYYKPNHEELCGAGYTVTITFIGLQPGTTAATISARSPIADNFDNIYDITVDEDLQITLSLAESKEISEP